MFARKLISREACGPTRSENAACSFLRDFSSLEVMSLSNNNLCLVQSAERPHRCPTLRMRSIDQTIDRQRFFLGSPTSRDRGKKEKGCARCVQILTLDN